MHQPTPIPPLRDLNASAPRSAIVNDQSLSGEGRMERSATIQQETPRRLKDFSNRTNPTEAGLPYERAEPATQSFTIV